MLITIPKNSVTSKRVKAQTQGFVKEVCCTALSGSTTTHSSDSQSIVFIVMLSEFLIHSELQNFNFTR